uniref:Uncharacterized protein n=1 Tax=Rhizophora mucronata TaxID=61149 RepID=A0A2P2IXH1_RHIMU
MARVQHLTLKQYPVAIFVNSRARMEGVV